MAAADNLYQKRWLPNLVRRLVGSLQWLRSSMAQAINEESERTAEEANAQDGRDLFDRLPDPPHLGFGQVRHYDGKLRYFDD